jgi:maltose/moltooligosaccharide transporter
MFVYWQFISLSVARTLFPGTGGEGADFISASLIAQQMGVAYNAVAFAGALALIPFVRRLGAKPVHAACLTVSGIAMLSLPMIDSRLMLFVPMIGIGLGWAGMMGNTYVMLADCIPPERTGVYMGIFNMFIVVPMLIETVTMPLIYAPLLGSDPRNAILLAGALMLCGAVATVSGRCAHDQLRFQLNRLACLAIQAAEQHVDQQTGSGFQILPDGGQRRRGVCCEHDVIIADDGNITGH